MTTIIARIRRSDGEVVQVHDDGTETVLERTPMPDLTFEQIEAAALSDPDAQPLTAEQIASSEPGRPIRRARRKLRLSRAEFAERFMLPLELLAAWERGTAVPDAGAANYLRLIQADPSAVQRMLAAGEPQTHPERATAAE